MSDSISSVLVPAADHRAAYLAAGFASRREYLVNLAEEYGVEPSTVFCMAHALGPSEDFDGLVTALEDGEGRWFE